MSLRVDYFVQTLNCVFSMALCVDEYRTREYFKRTRTKKKLKQQLYTKIELTRYQSLHTSR